MQNVTSPKVTEPTELHTGREIRASRSIYTYNIYKYILHIHEIVLAI